MDKGKLNKTQHDSSKYQAVIPTVRRRKKSKRNTFERQKHILQKYSSDKEIYPNNYVNQLYRIWECFITAKINQIKRLILKQRYQA